MNHSKNYMLLLREPAVALLWLHFCLWPSHTVLKLHMDAARTMSLLLRVWAWLAVPAPAFATHMVPTVALVTQPQASAPADQAWEASGVIAVSLAFGTSVASSLMDIVVVLPVAVTLGVP